MSSRRSRREERKDETRRELIDAAMKTFKERGFHAASLEQIAETAGYTAGAIYFHFGGRDGLFLAVFETYALTRVEEITDAYENASGGLPQRARALADQWMVGQSADPAFTVVTLEFFVHSLRHPELREALAARQAAVRLALGRIFEQAFRQEGIDPPLPAQEIVTVLREGGIGMAMARLLDPGAISESLHGEFVELFHELLLRQHRKSPSEQTRERA